MTTQIVARGLARAWLPILLGSFFEVLKFSPKAIQKGLFLISIKQSFKRIELNQQRWEN